MSAPNPHRSVWRGLAGLANALAWTAGGLLALSLALAVSTWLWSATAHSLPTVLRWTAGWLADGTGSGPLTVEGASGTLREGGRIERLRWQQNGLDVQLEDITLRWPNPLGLDLLLRRRATLSEVSVRQVRVIDERPETPRDARTPPSHLTLPWLGALEAHLRVERLIWGKDSAWQTGTLTLEYTYGPTPAGGHQHRARLSADLLAHGEYVAQAQLGAEGPLPLSLTVDGRVTPPAPKGGSPLELDTHLSATGPVAGPAPRLAVQARVTPASTPTAQKYAPQLDAEATVQPWAALPLAQGRLTFANLDLAVFWPVAPRTRLSGAWQADGTTPPASAPDSPAPPPAFTATDWRLQGTLRNDLAGPWNRARLPLERLQADVRWHDQAWELAALNARLAGGTLVASGRLPWAQGQPGAWEGRVALQGLVPQQMLDTLRVQPLDAVLDARADGVGPSATTHFRMDMGPSAGSQATNTRWIAAPDVRARGQWNQGTLTLAQLAFRVLGVDGEASGTAQPSQGRFDGRVSAQAPGATFRFDGVWGTNANRRSLAELDVTDLAALQRGLQTAEAACGQATTFAAQPALAPRWRTIRGQGRARLSAEWSATPPWELTHPAAAAGPWKLAVAADSLSLQAAEGTDPWRLRLDSFQLQADGEGRSWRLQHTAQAELGEILAALRGRLQARAHGTFASTAGGGLTANAELSELQLEASHPRSALGVKAELDGATTLGLGTDGTLSVGPGRLRWRPVSSGERRLPAMTQESGQLTWDRTRWSQGRLSGQGELRGLALSWVNAWLSDDDTPDGALHRAGVEGELLFDGQWDLNLPLAHAAPSPQPPSAALRLAHRSGDLVLVAGEGTRAERVSAGLKEASLALTFDRERLHGQLRWRSDNAGQAQGDFSTVLATPTAERPQWQWLPQAPVNGQLQADLPHIGLWSRLAPPGWRFSGRLKAQAQLSGTREQPVWGGRLQASEMAVRSLLDGIDFSDGQLQARLAGETLTIETLHLRGAGGEAGGVLTGQGQASWARRPNAGPAAREPVIDLKLQAQQLRVLARADRRLTLSGDLDARLRGTLLEVGGRLSVDQALLLLPDETTPTLGRDVVVRGTERPPGFGAGAAVQPQVRVAIDLGNQFRVRGLGIDTFLAGRLQVAASPGQSTPQITGQVNTVRGSYRAYGQALTVEQGRLRFNGPMDNPSLDILALRPHPTQRVGVQIAGTAQAPVVRLYSEPDLPDSEKLAWLVLGRPASGAGAEAAILQQAALALLSGSGGPDDRSLTRSLGLDELSIQGESSNPDGTAAAAAVTLGKRLSNQLYVTYSRSLAGVAGTVSVFYDLSRFVTLRAQAGDDNALDLIFTHSYDGQALPPRERRSGPRTIAPTSP